MPSPVRQPELVRYQHATRFGDDRDTLHPLSVVQTLKQRRDLLGPLEKATRTPISHQGGRPRREGSWALLYIAFVFSRTPDVEKFWRDCSHSLWRECGFTDPSDPRRSERPSYATTQRRFAELEKREGAFLRCANRLIEMARVYSGGRVGQYVHVDGTEAQSNTRIRHICPPGSACWKSTAQHRSATGDQSAVKEIRHQLADVEEPSDPADLPTQDFGQRDKTGRPIVDVNPTPRGLEVKLGDCWWHVTDKTAGFRAYTNPNGTTKKFWLGYYNLKATDHFTGAPLAVLLTSASVQEYHSYEPLMERVKEAVDGWPKAVVGDRGLSVSRVFQFNTERGIGSVFPWRGNGKRTRDQEDNEVRDRHGIPRCKHCGGPTRKDSFSKTSNSGPRLFMRCEHPVTDGCKRRQTVACKTDWRYLLPMWRTDPLYLALRESNSHFENTHFLWRTRYNVGADSTRDRPKRRGIACQQLRATAALLIEWLLICTRENWLGSTRNARTDRARIDPGRFIHDLGETAVQRLFKARAKQGLLGPYGPRAVALGIALLTPSPGLIGPPRSRPGAKAPPAPGDSDLSF